MKLKITLAALIIYSASYAVNSGNSLGQLDWINGKIVSNGKYTHHIDDQGNPVDYETGNRISISSARNISYARAKDKAVHYAVLAIKDLKIDTKTNLNDLILSSPEVRQNITRHLHEFSRFREKPAGYLATSCELQMNIGYIINTLGITFPEDDFPLRDDIQISTKYTSLIIDTRGLNIKPMLLPSVLSETGLAVYSKNNIYGKCAVKYLPVSYVFNDRDARKHKKAGKHPFYSIALKSLNGNPIISDEDIKRIYSHSTNLNFLKKCRVIFIIDR
ncbi:MAG TPA: hypothetical protein PK358_02150 [Spirochaetota bacterium]|nr:hypothetical protein [Spirochaetota bacterium]HPJ33607.1 hypothetical protein [Spirochaetota bacterium]